MGFPLHLTSFGTKHIKQIMCYKIFRKGAGQAASGRFRNRTLGPSNPHKIDDLSLRSVNLRVAAVAAIARSENPGLWPLTS